MSVAFRRDCDEEHLEPKFELPIPPGPNLVTPRGVRLMGVRIAQLQAGIALAAEDVERAALQRDLRYWNTRQITAEVAPCPSGDRVEFGTEVTLSFNRALRTFALVGDDEANPAAGHLSFTAPLSRAIMEAEPGDVIAFGGVADAIEILSITVAAQHYDT